MKALQFSYFRFSISVSSVTPIQSDISPHFRDRAPRQHEGKHCSGQIFAFRSLYRGWRSSWRIFPHIFEILLLANMKESTSAVMFWCFDLCIVPDALPEGYFPNFSRSCSSPTCRKALQWSDFSFSISVSSVKPIQSDISSHSDGLPSSLREGKHCTGHIFVSRSLYRRWRQSRVIFPHIFEILLLANV